MDEWTTGLGVLAGRLPVGRSAGRPPDRRTIRCRYAGGTTFASIRTPPYACRPLPPIHVLQDSTGTLEGTRHSLRASALSLICAGLAVTAAGCGESGSGGEGDPASLVPAGASFYREAAVQPQDERRDDALAAAGKIMRTDAPAAK